MGDDYSFDTADHHSRSARDPHPHRCASPRACTSALTPFASPSRFRAFAAPSNPQYAMRNAKSKIILRDPFRHEKDLERTGFGRGFLANPCTASAGTRVPRTACAPCPSARVFSSTSARPSPALRAPRTRAIECPKMPHNAPFLQNGSPRERMKPPHDPTCGSTPRAPLQCSRPHVPRSHP